MTDYLSILTTQRLRLVNAIQCKMSKEIINNHARIYFILEQNLRNTILQWFDDDNIIRYYKELEILKNWIKEKGIDLDEYVLERY